MIQQLVEKPHCLWTRVRTAKGIEVCSIDPNYRRCFTDEDLIDEDGEDAEECFLSVREILERVVMEMDFQCSF